MMLRLERYIAAQVLSAVFVILLIVLGLDLIFEFVAQAADINERYTMSDVLYYLAYRAPGRLYEFLPLASLVGCLVGLGMLASNSELTVMRAAGISIGRIVMAVMKPAILLALIAVLMGEYVVPHSEQVAESSRALAKSNGQALRSEHGVWHREDNQFIHINAVEPGGKIHGITRYTFDERLQMVSASFAATGTYSEQGWILKEIQQTAFLGDRTQVSSASQELWQSGLTPALLSVIVVEPVDLSISGLWSYTGYLAEQGLDANQYLLAFWTKVLQPMGILALVLVGVSFVFGPLRSVTVGQRIVAGVIVGLVFKFSQDLLGPASLVVGFTPLVATMIPIAVCAGVGFILLKRAG